MGNVAPGTAQSPASHLLKIGNKFQPIRLFLVDNQGPLSIQITYDPITFQVFDFTVFAMPMAASA